MGSSELASVKAASLFRAFSISRRQTRVPLAKPITQWLIKELRMNSNHKTQRCKQSSLARSFFAWCKSRNVWYGRREVKIKARRARSWRWSKIFFFQRAVSRCIRSQRPTKLEPHRQVILMRILLLSVCQDRAIQATRRAIMVDKAAVSVCAIF